MIRNVIACQRNGSFNAFSRAAPTAGHGGPQRTSRTIKVLVAESQGLPNGFKQIEGGFEAGCGWAQGSKYVWGLVG